MNIILIIGIAAVVIAFSMKKSYQMPHYSFAIEGGLDKTLQILTALRERTNNYTEYIDVFEASATGLLFTNVGIVYGENAEKYIPYAEIISISEPVVAVDDGIKKKAFREFEVHTKNGSVKMLFANSKNNTFLTMIREFNKSKYPKTDYVGYRGGL